MRPILLNLLTSHCPLRPSGLWCLKSLVNPKPKCLAQLGKKQSDQLVCNIFVLNCDRVQLWQSHCSMLTSHLAPSTASSLATQIPATKWIHLALVFFAHLFLLILLFTAPRKGERSPAHFLDQYSTDARKQPLFLIDIWGNGACSVGLHISVIPQTISWCRSDLLGLLPQDNLNNFTDNCRVQPSLCLRSFFFSSSFFLGWYTTSVSMRKKENDGSPARARMSKSPPSYNVC